MSAPTARLLTGLLAMAALLLGACGPGGATAQPPAPSAATSTPPPIAGATSRLPAAINGQALPFSEAVRVGDVLYLSGQLGRGPDGKLPDGIEAQTRQVMENLKSVLRGCHLGLSNVVSARVFLVCFEDDYAAMNRVYAEYFPPGKYPARTCVGVTALARGARVEIDMIARRPL